MLSFLKSTLLFFILLSIPVLLSAQHSYWQQELHYELDVKLDDQENTLDGFLKLDYRNHSPDTLKFIWFHLWPNAFKNDRTAFSDQLLENGRTDFYFSSREQRGYINRLDFRVDDQPARMEDHPSHIDIVKVVLPTPLPPGGSIRITTPFHVKLPYNFSRGGHVDQSYQVTQWYPKPAVYDRYGWHEMPYLDQGEFYSDFGTYLVKITLPKNYVVAATGRVQDRSEMDWATNTERQNAIRQLKPEKPKSGWGRKKQLPPVIPSSTEWKTLVYQQERIHDFAWFADKRYLADRDTVQLEKGEPVECFSYYLPEVEKTWKSGIQYLRDAIRVHSREVGGYPYATVSIVQGPMGFSGGMEYPTITLISGAADQASLRDLVFHEVGHNWFYGVLASNERVFPWMDEGINTYYDNRYKASFSVARPHARIPSDLEGLALKTVEGLKWDQPIATPSEKLTWWNYGLISYTKTGEWMKQIEYRLGTERFDQAMQDYYQHWGFKHPYPDDFKESLEKSSGTNLDSLFGLLQKKGSLYPPQKKKFKVEPFFNFTKTEQYNYLFISPLIGFNKYDGIMLGTAIHNYTLPLPRFRYVLTPFYATGSGKITGLGRISYDWYPNQSFRNIELFLSGSHFTRDDYKDSAGHKTTLGYSKLAPGIRLEFREPGPRSTRYRYLQFKYYWINEDELSFMYDSIQNRELVSKEKADFGLAQIKLSWNQFRSLYPYNFDLVFESGKDFGRLALTTNYFFNFRKKGGINLRLFGGKFFYYGDKSISKEFETDRFHLNMSGPKGDEDYTYSNYFFGRNEFEGFASQQIMKRDGFFKVRTDLLNSKVGKTDNWLAAMNLTMDVPDRFNILNLLPIKIPLKLFADFGTYSEAWEEDSDQSRFLYDAGFQISVLRELVNIYIPVVYSDQYRDYFKSVPGNGFWQRISFSIDIQDLSFRKWLYQGAR